MNSAKTGIGRLLIASAIEPEVYRRLMEFPEATFDEFGLGEEDRELLRHPDHRLLRHLGATLAEDGMARGENAVPAIAAPQNSAALPVAPAGQGVTLADMSLVLTLQPCAQYEGEQLHHFAYAVWVSPLPEGADPATVPPPAGTVLPGKPLAPLRAVIRVSAVQLQDAAGGPLVGLTAALQHATNISAPPPPETAGKPGGSDLGPGGRSPAVESAIAAVRGCRAEDRYHRLLELLQVLHPERTT